MILQQNQEKNVYRENQKLLKIREIFTYHIDKSCQFTNKTMTIDFNIKGIAFILRRVHAAIRRQYLRTCKVSIYCILALCNRYLFCT